MDFVKASFKISECIDTATTSEHHKSINTMIKTVRFYAKKQSSDKSVLGGLALLDWQNANKYFKLRCKNKLLKIW